MGDTDELHLVGYGLVNMKNAFIYEFKKNTNR